MKDHGIVARSSHKPCLSGGRGGSLEILLLPGEGSHFLTTNIKGGLGDLTLILIRIPPAHPPSKK